MSTSYYWSSSCYQISESLMHLEINTSFNFLTLDGLWIGMFVWCRGRPKKDYTYNNFTPQNSIVCCLISDCCCVAGLPRHWRSSTRHGTRHAFGLHELTAVQRTDSKFTIPIEEYWLSSAKGALQQNICLLSSFKHCHSL